MCSILPVYSPNYVCSDIQSNELSSFRAIHAPEEYSAISITSYCKIAIRRERHAAHRPVMPLQDTDLLATARLPHACRLIPRAGQHQLAIRRERHAAHRLVVPLQDADLLATARLPL